MEWNKLTNLSSRPIAMTDLETTGDVFSVHEIIEIGLVVFDQKTFAIIDTLNVKIKPQHIEKAVPAALERNGYKEADWKEAVTLTGAIKMYNEKTKGVIFASFNVSFDWGFMNEAFRITGIDNQMDYHRLDVLSLAWERVLKTENSWSLKRTCEILGIPPEPDIHTALNGARTAYEVFRKLQLDK
jgi:DNA polymerase III epsilon subunit-like protein